MTMYIYNNCTTLCICQPFTIHKNNIVSEEPMQCTCVGICAGHVNVVVWLPSPTPSCLSVQLENGCMRLYIASSGIVN